MICLILYHFYNDYNLNDLPDSLLTKIDQYQLNDFKLV